MKKMLVKVTSLLAASLWLLAAGCASNPPAEPSPDDADEQTTQELQPDYRTKDRPPERRPSSPRGLGFPGGDPTLSPIPFP